MKRIIPKLIGLAAIVTVMGSALTACTVHFPVTTLVGKPINAYCAYPLEFAPSLEVYLKAVEGGIEYNISASTTIDIGFRPYPEKFDNQDAKAAVSAVISEIQKGDNGKISVTGYWSNGSKTISGGGTKTFYEREKRYDYEIISLSANGISFPRKK